jgi:hypothetical protein
MKLCGTTFDPKAFKRKPKGFRYIVIDGEPFIYNNADRSIVLYTQDDKKILVPSYIIRDNPNLVSQSFLDWLKLNRYPSEKAYIAESYRIYKKLNQVK